METSNIIEVTHLNKQFLVDKQPMEVLHDISLQVKQGEFITIVGHSGCGKSTLLKIICGFVGYEDGQVKIKDNVGFGLGDLPKQERDEKVRKHLELVGLAGFKNSYPSQLSGGMSQRAAIARGLANNPTILLLDEPFGALDALTRIQMQKEILRIQEKEGTTMVMVTHDIDEAIYLGDRIVVMSARPGEIKDIIEVDRAAAGKRSGAEFAAYKKKIYDYFFEDSDEKYEVEYVI